MKLLYLSALCTKTEYERMFRTYGTTSSHASQKFHRSITQGLLANGIDVTALSCRVISNPLSNDLIKEPETEDGLLYHYLPHAKNRKLNRLYMILKTYQFVTRWHKENKNGVICSDIIGGEFSIALFLFSLIHRCKKIGIVTDVPSVRAAEKRTGLKAIPLKIKNSLIQQFDAYVFLTEKMSELLNPKKKPYVVIEGVIDKIAYQYENSFAQKHPEKVCMMAGLLEKDFGVDDLLEAFHRLPDTDVRLNFYGKGTSVSTINEYAKKDPRIQFCGELLNTQILDEERKATLLINPRPPIGEWTMYSFPSKNMEYISSGTPMLAYNLHCIPPEYADYFYPIEKEGIFEALNAVLKQSAQELFDFGAKARNWILTEKTPEKQTEKLANMIKNL